MIGRSIINFGRGAAGVFGTQAMARRMYVGAMTGSAFGGLAGGIEGYRQGGDFQSFAKGGARGAHMGMMMGAMGGAALGMPKIRSHIPFKNLARGDVLRYGTEFDRKIAPHLGPMKQWAKLRMAGRGMKQAVAHAGEIGI